jgi:hypothetical protein
MESSARLIPIRADYTSRSESSGTGREGGENADLGADPADDQNLEEQTERVDEKDPPNGWLIR